MLLPDYPAQHFLLPRWENRNKAFIRDCLECMCLAKQMNQQWNLLWQTMSVCVFYWYFHTDKNGFFGIRHYSVCTTLSIQEASEWSSVKVHFLGREWQTIWWLLWAAFSHQTLEKQPQSSRDTVTPRGQWDNCTHSFQLNQQREMWEMMGEVVWRGGRWGGSYN